MSEEKELKFVRLRTTLDDLVGYVTYKPECIVIETPLRIDVETIFDEGRQILCMQEYLPQTVIELKEVEIPTSDIMFVTPVREQFIEQYEYVRDFFYNNETKIRSPLAQKKTEELPETAEKVVSIFEALASKKDKPIH
jgi:acyl CoA:acetate/3-ketoacid CoA transferase